MNEQAIADALRQDDVTLQLARAAWNILALRGIIMNSSCDDAEQWQEAAAKWMKAINDKLSEIDRYRKALQTIIDLRPDNFTTDAEIIAQLRHIAKEAVNDRNEETHPEHGQSDERA